MTYYIGQKLEGKYNGYTVEVVGTEPAEKGVTVLASGERVNTTERYLSALYVEV